MLQHYFEEFGHKCNLNFNDPLDKAIKNKSRLQLWFIRNSIISKNLILLRSRPRSFAALRNEILYHLEYYPKALHPLSYITFYSELIWMFVVFIILVILPFDVFKYLDEPPSSHYNDQYLFLALSTVSIYDCIRRFFTGYLIKHDDRDEIVLDFRRISINYIRTYFFIDFLSIIAQYLKIIFPASPIYYVIYESMQFLKFVRLGSILNVLRNAMHFYKFRQGIIHSVVEIIRICFIFHWVACLSVLAAYLDRYFDSTSQQWIDYLSLPETFLWDKYIFCLHRTTSLLTGTGFQFNKVNNKFPVCAVTDMLFTIFTVILGHILTLILIGHVYEIVQGMRGSAAAYEGMLNEVSQYMKHRRLIQKGTRNKIKTYYGFKYNHSFFNENAILSSIPNVLGERIMLHCAKLVRENVELFKKLPESVVANLVHHLGKEIVLSGDVIYRCNEKGYTMFFIESGTTAAFNCKGRELDHQEDGSYFGAIVFTERAANHQYPGTMVAIETCEIFELKSKDYYALMDYCPDLVHEMETLVFERFENQISLEERYDELLNKELQLKERDEPSISSNF